MELKDKIRIGLDEDRMLVLVVQVLIGFDYKAVFEAKFVELPVLLQYLKLFSLAAQLITLMLLLAIPSYHRIAEQGENSAHFCRVIKRLMAIALFPFAFSFGAEFAIPGLKAFGSVGSVVLPTTVALFAYFFWHGFPMLMRTRNGHKTMEKKQAVTLSDKIKQTLTEARVVLPGTQALLGFQLIIFLSHSFDQLPKSSQLLHLAALGCVGASAILLMTPPAYHRIAEDGEESEGFQILTSRFLVAAMAFLAAGVALDFYVVLWKTLMRPKFSILIAIVFLVIFYGLWFAYPVVVKYRRKHSRASN